MIVTAGATVSTVTTWLALPTLPPDARGPTETIRLATRLHDVGMTVIPARMLREREAFEEPHWR